MPLPKGFKHSAATREKMRIYQKSRPPISDETKKKMSLSSKGKKKTPESIRKMTETKRNNPRYGERSSNWKGGKTRLTQLVRSSFQYRQWRSDVFERDNYFCTGCGKKSNGDIEVHHIKQMAQIIADRKVNTIEEAVRCEELWNINNGVTLCVECHKKTDTYRNQKICVCI